MDDRFRQIAAFAAVQHGVVSTQQLVAAGISSSLRSKWERHGLITRLGSRSFAVGASVPTFELALAGGLFDLASFGVAAGRAGARLHGLDGFSNAPAEFLVPRAHRGCVTNGRVCSTVSPLTRADVVTVRGFPCLTAERLRLVAEERLRSRVLREHRSGVNGSRLLLDAIVDAGGESRLERWFLQLVRQAGIAKPMLQRTFRDTTRVVARVDAYFPGGLVVEIAGHGTHASRRQRQVDSQRHTELTLRGLRVLTFTYDDIRDRPSWVIARLRDALAMTHSHRRRPSGP